GAVQPHVHVPVPGCPRMPGVACLDQTEGAVWFLAESSSRQPSVATTFRYAASAEVHSHSPVPSFPGPARRDGSGSPWGVAWVSAIHKLDSKHSAGMLLRVYPGRSGSDQHNLSKSIRRETMQVVLSSSPLLGVWRGCAPSILVPVAQRPGQSAHRRPKVLRSGRRSCGGASSSFPLSTRQAGRRRYRASTLGP